MPKQDSEIKVLKQIGAQSAPDPMMIKDKGNRITPEILYVTEVITIPESPRRSPSPAPSSPDYNYHPHTPSPPSSPRDKIELLPEHQTETETNAPPSTQASCQEVAHNHTGVAFAMEYEQLPAAQTTSLVHLINITQNTLRKEGLPSVERERT